MYASTDCEWFEAEGIVNEQTTTESWVARQRNCVKATIGSPSGKGAVNHRPTKNLHVARSAFREYARQYPDRRMTLQIAAHVIDEHVPAK